MFAKVPSPVEVIPPPFALVKKRFVEDAVVAKLFVEVAKVVVERVALKFEAKRFVDEEVPAKKLVVVALDPVALVKVKF